MKREIEGAEQTALFDWVEIAKGTMPELALLFHIPNGGLRSKTEAARMKRQGVKAGVPDMLLPAAEKLLTPGCRTSAGRSRERQRSSMKPAREQSKPMAISQKRNVLGHHRRRRAGFDT